MSEPIELFESDAVWRSVTGAKAVEVLNGLVTNDVSTLPDGGAQIAVALTPKGKVIADLTIVRDREDRLLVGASAASAAAWHDMLRKYVNPRLAKIAEEPGLSALLLVGSDASRVAALARGAAEGADEAVTIPVVARIALTREPAPWIAIGDAPAIASIRARMADAGIVVGSEERREIVRVESGWPAFGRDMDENTIPQEANLDTLGAISFSKGCYTGQETVARVHFRGHVNRHLRGLSAEQPLERGSSLTDATGKTVGDVRSTVHSPRFGHIALAMVRREVPIGTELQVEQQNGAITARVVELPFS